MRIEDFLRRHGLNRNPFANAEEAQGDDILLALIHSRDFHFGHPQWQKFCGDPPGNQTSLVFGLKGSGKTAMRLAITEAIKAHNERSDEKTLFIEYDEFSAYLDTWEKKVGESLEREHGVWDKMRRRKRGQVTQAQHWRMAHHVDAIVAEASRKFEEILPEPAKTRQWDPHLRYNALYLAAVFLPLTAGDYRRTFTSLHKRLTTGWERFKHGTGEALKTIFTLGIYLWAGRNGLAHHLTKSVQVLERDPRDLRWALRRFPRQYLDQPLKSAVDASNEPHRYMLLNNLVEVARAAGYKRVVVVIDKVDEPAYMGGDYDRMFLFIKPLLKNKLLQTSGIHFKMLLPEQLHMNVRKASTTEANVGRLDKANVIHPLTWTGEQLYEMLAERASVCRDGDATGVFQLSQMLADDLPPEHLIRELERMRIPRYGAKFMNRLVADTCATLPPELPEGELPKIPASVFYKVSQDLESDIRNTAQTLQEI